MEGQWVLPPPFIQCPVFSKISAMKILFLHLGKGSLSFKKKETRCIRDTYGWGTEWWGHKESYEGSCACTLMHSIEIKARKRKKRENNYKYLTILVGWKGSWITENTCFLSLKSHQLPILTKDVFVAGGSVNSCIRTFSFHDWKSYHYSCFLVSSKI